MERIGTRESTNSEAELIRHRSYENGATYGSTDVILRIEPGQPKILYTTSIINSVISRSSLLLTVIMIGSIVTAAQPTKFVLAASTS